MRPAWPRRRSLLQALVLTAWLALLAWAVSDGLLLSRQWQYNWVIETAAAPLPPGVERAGEHAEHAELPASTLFVRAHAAAGERRTQDALALYQAAGRDPVYTVAAQYNLGNLHLREALALHLRGELQTNPQPAELAKRHYRAALRADPGHWPSKYNLERALHLAPELPDDTAAAGHASQRAVTSLRGFTLGLP